MIKKLLSLVVVGVFAVFAMNFGAVKADSSSYPLMIWNKTNGLKLMGDWEVHGYVGQNIVFTPNMMTNMGHHYTLKMVDMNSGQIVYYKTKVSRWSMENPRQDAWLGWTTWKTGAYWLQIDSYGMDGSSLGWEHTILHVHSM